MATTSLKRRGRHDYRKEGADEAEVFGCYMIEEVMIVVDMSIKMDKSGSLGLE